MSAHIQVMSHIQRSTPVRNPDGTETWTETRRTPEGVYTRSVTGQGWDFQRSNCFCCTCFHDDSGYLPSSDPACRNHGFDGARPCQEHGMPGEPDNAGHMPASVQAHRAEHERKGSLPSRVGSR